jgi:hypothetical protein
MLRVDGYDYFLFKLKEGFNSYAGMVQRYINYATSRPERYRLLLIQQREKNKLSVLENCAVLAVSRNTAI